MKHHPALPYQQARAFMHKLVDQPGFAALALQFTILTAARTSEVTNATWDEMDLDGREWVIPGDRMKSGKPHRVPLSAAAVAVLKAAKVEGEHCVFPGQKRGTSLSNMTMLALLRRMGYGHITVHGFRSTFRDWAAEQTHYPNHVVEMALAHVISDKVERAYRRGELLEKRRGLMKDWAAYVGRENQRARDDGAKLGQSGTQKNSRLPQAR